MTFDITQTCDGCGADRDITVSRNAGIGDLTTAANHEGWREVRTGQHLCPACIRKALKR